MRWVVCVALLLALVPRAFAGEYDILRGAQPVGPATFTRWSGFYAGGQYGWSDANADFSNATSGPVAYALRFTTLESQDSPSTWPVLGTADHGSSAFGAFAGYNTQWQDLILGLETNYQHTLVTLKAQNNPIARVVPAGSDTDTVSITGSGSVSNLDFLSLRARAGWVLGNFLPYGFVGFALGRADIAVAANVSVLQCPSGGGACGSFSFDGSAGKSGELLYGFAVGGGMDVALTPNIFVRGEYEYTRFAPIANVLLTVTSARVGAGFKF
jgi:opacity protein-like surface antigen